MKRDVFFWLLLLVAALYRFWLWDNFAGWEESDYGNIAMVRGVWESGFRNYDMNHMPGYYCVSALFLFLHSDAVWASKLTATLSGLTSLIVIASLMYRYVGRIPAFLLILVLLIQPEFSLYASSALREPLYAAFIAGMLLFVLKEYWFWAGTLAAAAFLVRFEFPLVLFPLGIFIVRKHSWKAVFKIATVLGLAILLWGVYCMQVHGTFQFWSHATETNIESGSGAEAASSIAWIIRGFKVSSLLLFTVLSSRVGWFIWLGWLLSPFMIRPGQKAYVIMLLSFSLVGIWLAIAFFAQHEVNHNLYWKWMYPLVPFVSFCGVFVLWRISRDWGLRAKAFFWVVILVGTMVPQYQESHRQIERAERLYSPQIRLATFIEEQAPKDRLLLVDNIPERWINRKPNSFRIISWHDVPVASSNPMQFARWIQENDVWCVLWFKEEWTQAPKIAPFLAAGTQWKQEEVVLTPHSKEEDYGWIFYLRER